MSDTRRNLGRGYVDTYESEGNVVKVVYTGDPIDDRVVVVEKGDTLLSIEAPLFREDVEVFNNFVLNEGKKMNYVLLSNHTAPLSVMKEATLLSTEKAVEGLEKGEARGLFTNFCNIFGDLIEKETRSDYNLLKEGREKIGDVEISIIPNGETFDVGIGSKIVYLHMLGYDTHSIIAGAEGGKAMISTLESYLEKGYEIFLTSHHDPETRDDVKTKIAYVHDIIDIANRCNTREEFVSAVKEKYPSYKGLNYLDITASIFFPGN